MRFRQPRCPKCGTWPSTMAGIAPTQMHLYRLDATQTVADEDDDDALDFEHDGSDVCWEYEDSKRTPEGKVELFCPDYRCTQHWWHTEVLSEREVELEDAVRYWAEAQQALEPNAALATHEEAGRAVAAENRLQELMQKRQA